MTEKTVDGDNGRNKSGGQRWKRVKGVDGEGYGRPHGRLTDDSARLSVVRSFKSFPLGSSVSARKHFPSSHTFRTTDAKY